MSSYRGVAPSFIYKIDHRFPKTGDLKSSGKKYTLETQITKLIVYSNGVSKVNVTTWRMSPDEDVAQRTETWEIKPRDECDLPLQIQNDRGMGRRIF